MTCAPLESLFQLHFVSNGATFDVATNLPSMYVSTEVTPMLSTTCTRVVSQLSFKLLSIGSSMEIDGATLSTKLWTMTATLASVSLPLESFATADNVCQPSWILVVSQLIVPEEPLVLARTSPSIKNVTPLILSTCGDAARTAIVELT